MPDADPIFLKLREQAFTWTDHRAPKGVPTGFILETGFDTGSFTLVALSDGAVSLYFSNGGGMIGMGGRKGPAEAATRLVRQAVRFKDELLPVSEHPLPAEGEARLYVLIDGGLRGAAAPQEIFGENRSPFSPLFHAAHALIAAIRKVHEDGAKDPHT